MQDGIANNSLLLSQTENRQIHAGRKEESEKTQLLQELLARPESKTLEFKENAHSLSKIVQTVIAFANTAGGTLVIGIQDKTKNIIGIENILQDEERIANAIADSVIPILLPNLQFISWRDKDLLIVNVPHSPGPFYLKDKGEEAGVYVRLGSTNRIADASLIAEIKRIKEHTSFDQLPEPKAAPDDLDVDLARKLFATVNKPFTQATAQSLELIVDHRDTPRPTKGGLMLFGKQRDRLFPDPFVRLVRFEGTTKTTAIDHADIKSAFPLAIDEILAFIRRNTSMRAVIQSVRRTDIPEYPPEAVREAVINALLHTDYSTMRSSIQVAIFDDRMEVTNPGPLPLGLSLEAALSGVSQLRNKVLGRVFRELKLIEQWGSGLTRMREVCLQHGGILPKFEELGFFFRVTLYPRMAQTRPQHPWYTPIFDHIQQYGKISVLEADKIWKVTRKTANQRLKQLSKEGLLIEISKGPFDPHKVFVLAKPES
ncbi:MAG TPA: helix-turn-helix domain-containing protein [Chlamydiales bacterium]|nr:helix-turn-helix domain-containing protein [Chlamydiales bacterium]